MKRTATVLTGLALTLFAATLQASEFEVSFRDLTTLSSRPDNDDENLDNPTTSSTPVSLPPDALPGGDREGLFDWCNLRAHHYGMGRADVGSLTNYLESDLRPGDGSVGAGSQTSKQSLDIRFLDTSGQAPATIPVRLRLELSGSIAAGLNGAAQSPSASFHIAVTLDGHGIGSGTLELASSGTGIPVFEFAQTGILSSGSGRFSGPSVRGESVVVDATGQSSCEDDNTMTIQLDMTRVDIDWGFFTEEVEVPLNTVVSLEIETRLEHHFSRVNAPSAPRGKMVSSFTTSFPKSPMDPSITAVNLPAGTVLANQLVDIGVVVTNRGPAVFDLSSVPSAIRADIGVSSLGAYSSGRLLDNQWTGAPGVGLAAGDYTVALSLEFEQDPGDIWRQSCNAPPQPWPPREILAPPDSYPDLIEPGESETINIPFAFPQAGSQGLNVRGEFPTGDEDLLSQVVEIGLPAPMLCGTEPGSASPGEEIAIQGNWFRPLNSVAVPTVFFQDAQAEVVEVVSPLEMVVEVPDMGCRFGPVPLAVSNGAGEEILGPWVRRLGEFVGTPGRTRDEESFSLAPLSDMRIDREQDLTGPYCFEDVTVSVLGLADNCLDVDIHLRSGLGAQLDGNRVVVDEVLPARRYLSRPIFKGQDPRTNFDLTIPGSSTKIPPGLYQLTVEPGQSPEDGVGTQIFIGCVAKLAISEMIVAREGGLVVILAGEGLDQVERVELGGSEAKFDIASDTELTVFVPEGVSGEQILVVHGGGQAVKQVVSIKAAERGARLEGLEIVERTRSGYVMRLTGTQFTRDMVEGLRVGGARVEKVDFVSSEEITLVVPATLIPKSGEVSISLVDKTGEISRNFTLEK